MNTIDGVGEVAGCDDCPFAKSDKYGDYYCGHPSSEDESYIEFSYPEIDTILVTPSWCPLKQSPITIKLIDK